MNKSEQINELATSLAKAQGMIPNPTKNRVAKIPTKNGGSYSYEYADLPCINDAIREALAKNDLSISQDIDWEKDCVVTLLMHSSGQWLESTMKIFPKSSDNEAQAVAAAVTFARRYGVCCVLNIAAETDDDEQHIPETTRPPVQKPKEPLQKPTGFISEYQAKELGERLQKVGKLDYVLSHYNLTQMRDLLITDYASVLKSLTKLEEQVAE